MIRQLEMKKHNVVKIIYFDLRRDCFYNVLRNATDGVSSLVSKELKFKEIPIYYEIPIQEY